jgi:hypothetical protein
MIITEWVTWITDLMITLQCFYFGASLWRHSRSKVSLWSLVFFVSGGAALMGALQHGLHENFSDTFYKLSSLWIIMLLALASLMLGGIFSRSFLSHGKFQRLFQGFLFLKFLFFVYQGLRSPHFGVAIMDYGSTLVLLLLAYVSSVRSRPGAYQIIFAILIALMGAYIQSQKIALHRLFNHNDLFHIVQFVSFYFFYQGARRELDSGWGTIDFPASI